jgi:hypothetical protein
VGDSTTVDQECKKQAIWKHFNDIFGTYKPCVSSINFSSLPFPEVQLESLSAPILAEEVRAAVLEMHPEKAPGPDGFTGLFYRVAWDIIVSDLMKAIRLLENGGQQGLNLLNDALLVLLPKTSEAAKPSDYKPISLIHSFGKLFTKIMARRLQPLMPTLVEPCQSAFIKGRAIHDNFVYVQGVIHSLKRKKIPALMMKLDISMAFESLQIMEACIKCNMSFFLERLGLVLISCCARDTSLARRPCCLGHQVSHSTSCCLSGSVFEAPLYYSVTGVFFLQTCSHPTTVTPELRNSRWYQVSG